MHRLLLVRHATTAHTRRACFPVVCGARPGEPDEPLDRAGVAQASALAAHLPRADRCWSSFARRAQQTAQLLGLEPEADADLAECDFGTWAGRTPSEVDELDAAGLRAWYADPDAATHGGESFSQVRSRARTVLDRAAALAGTTVAVTHGGLVKAVVLEVLGLTNSALWRVDVGPASVTEVHGGDGGWRMARVNWTPALSPGARVA